MNETEKKRLALLKQELRHRLRQEALKKNAFVDKLPFASPARLYLSCFAKVTRYSELSLFPPYIMERVTVSDKCNVGKLDDAPRCIGNWSSYWQEGMPPFFNIEWINVRPRHGIYRGRLVDDDVLDATEEFIAILKKVRYFL